MADPNIIGSDLGAKWLFEDTNTKIITLFRENSGGDFPQSDLSMHTPSASSLTGVDYQVPASKQFRLMTLNYGVDATTNDQSFGIIASTSADDPSAGTKVWNWFFENSGATTTGSYPQNFDFGAGLPFGASTYVTLYDLDGLTSVRYVCTGWGVEYDA